MCENCKDRNYNGWTNYETWVVRLWLDNEEPSYRYWTGQARRWHGREGAACRLAEQLKGELSDASPLNEPTVYGDLMNAALEEVDWLEIAESYLDEVDEGRSAAERLQGDTVPEAADSGRRAELVGPGGDVRTERGCDDGRKPERGRRDEGRPGAAKDALPADVAKSIDELLRYLWSDEVENFIADEPGPDEEHVFRHIVVVDGWFYGHDATAEELVEEWYSDDDRARVRERVRTFRGE